MKWLTRILSVLGIIFLLFLVVQFFMPSQLDVTVEKEYNAPSEQLYKAFANTEKFNAFNQWMRIDPENTKVEYSEIKEGKGAYYKWSNTVNVNEVGTGSLTVVEANPNKLVKYEMRFGEDPTPNIGQVTITEENKKTKVVWSFVGAETPFMFRFLNKVFHGMVSDNMNQSLDNLEEYLKEVPKVEEKPIEIQKETAITQFSEPTKVIALFQETSTRDMQEIGMAFQESMGLLYSYLVDDQHLEAGKDFTNPIGIYELWDEKNNVAKFYVGFIVNAEVPAGEGMQEITIPSSNVIKQVYQGPYEETGKVHEAINQFIQKEKIEVIGMPFEIYKSAPSVPDSQKVTEIYYPVK